MAKNAFSGIEHDMFCNDLFRKIDREPFLFCAIFTDKIEEAAFSPGGASCTMKIMSPEQQRQHFPAEFGDPVALRIVNMPALDGMFAGRHEAPPGGVPRGANHAMRIFVYPLEMAKRWDFNALLRRHVKQSSSMLKRMRHSVDFHGISLHGRRNEDENIRFNILRFQAGRIGAVQVVNGLPRANRTTNAALDAFFREDPCLFEHVTFDRSGGANLGAFCTPEAIVRNPEIGQFPAFAGGTGVT